MYFKIKLVYNDLSKTLKELLEETGIEIESYDENNHKDKKKAITLKKQFGAVQTPFAVFYYKDKVQKAFYSEDSTCSTDKIIAIIKDWIFHHAHKGYMRIEQIKGSQVGRKERGQTFNFMEGVSLHLSTISTWYHTSPIESINWENHTFKTKNSVYSFEIDSSNLKDISLKNC